METSTQVPSSIDPCNGYWANFGSTYDFLGNPMCQFGATTDAESQASAWWSAGSVIVMSMEMPNPYDNWQIRAPGSNTGVACPGQSGGYIAQGDSIDCSGITPGFASEMLTPGTFRTLNGMLSCYHLLNNCCDFKQRASWSSCACFMR